VAQLKQIIDGLRAVPVEVEIKVVPVTEEAARKEGVTEVGGVGIKPKVKQHRDE